MNHNYAGADWLKAQLPSRNRIEAATHERRVKRNKGKLYGQFVPMELSPFGARVADLLGFVFRGLYHIAGPVDRADWSRKGIVEICLSGELATFDSSALTELVILCHDQRIRFSVEAAARGYIRLIFCDRKSRDGSFFERHPTIDSAIETIRRASKSEVLP